MTELRKQLGLLFLLLSVAQGLFAAESLILSPQKAIQIGMENSKSLHASKMNVWAAQASASEETTSMLPQLSFGGNYARLSSVPPFAVTVPGTTPDETNTFTLSPSIVNSSNLRFSVQQPLFTGFRLKANSDMQEYTAKASEFDYARDRNQLAYDIQVAYWNLYKAGEFKKVIDENVDQVEAHLKDVQNLQAQGLATYNDLLTVQVQLSNAKLTQIDATDNVRLAAIALNNQIGLPLDTEVTLDSEIDWLGGPPLSDTLRMAQAADLDQMVRRALENRGELKSLESRAKVGKAGVMMARSGWFPQIYFSGNYYYARPNQRILPTQDAFKDTWDLGVTASFDLWNWGVTAHETDRAEAQLAQAKDALAQAKDGITLEVTQDYLSVNQAKQKIGVAADGVKQAKESYRITREKYESGLAPNSELIDAENAQLRAEWSYTQSVVDFELAQSKLAKATGKIGN